MVAFHELPSLFIALCIEITSLKNVLATNEISESTHQLCGWNGVNIENEEDL